MLNQQNTIKKRNLVLAKLNKKIHSIQDEKESAAYDAFQFKMDNLTILNRTAKITPTKIGQFVVLWKRIPQGVIAPFDDFDEIDLVVINCETETNFGQFIFPKNILIEKGIFSTPLKEGKRAFRVYPIWETAINKQAISTQKWQMNYFLNCTQNEEFDLKRAQLLYLQN